MGYIAKGAVKGLSKALDNLVLLTLFVIFLFAGYSLYDSHLVFQAADVTRFETYKPTKENTLSFDELRAVNPDVISWLTVYDTGIDYPVLRSPHSNDDYLSRNPLGEVQASGSLFLDHRNASDFSDHNTIIFGHHMAGGVMFGDLDRFLEEDFFLAHRYGNLFLAGQNRGLEFYAMLVVDARETNIYRVPSASEDAYRQYLQFIDTHAKFHRETTVTEEDHIVLLSTCSADITNGRYILVGKLLDREVPDPFPKESEDQSLLRRIDVFNWLDTVGLFPIWRWYLGVLLAILITTVLWRLEHHRYRRAKARRAARQSRKPHAKETNP
ncbi:MAG: class B sortase [Clostridia bacterium]|nr:class B sortase [Clostridia bacterium]